ncbi:MAG: sugar phosphate isomerase/epimerase family protein, partial [Kiritimatiellia bacterium]
MFTRRMFLGTGSLALVAAGCRSFGTGCAAPGAKAKVPFRFGIAGYTFHRCTLDETLAYMKALDMHYLCIKDFHLPFKSTAAEIRAFHQKCADSGVTGYGVGPIYLKKDEARRYFDYAKAVGVKVLVAVPYEEGMVNGKKQRCASRACCEALSELCKEYDIRVAIHNHGPDIPYC